MRTSVPTCECGLSYVVGHPDDERRHAYEHAQYLRGPVMRVLRRIPRIENIDGLAVHLVDGTVPLVDRRKFYQGIALIWCRTIPGPAGYDGTVNDDDQKLFLVADGQRIVCALLSALDRYAWPLGWVSDGRIELRGSSAVLAPRQKIARVWTARDYRLHGLAVRLVDIASQVLSVVLTDLGWELPFTSNGAAFVRRLCPDAFWGCGDGFTLHEVLDASERDKRNSR